MARNRKNKKLWKCRKYSTFINPPKITAAAAPASAAPIPSHLSESDHARRRSCERRLVDIIETRLIREGREMELGDLAKIQKMLCELKKQDIAAENHQLARAKAQAQQDEFAAEQAERNKPELSPEESSARLQQIINEIYGLDPYIVPQPQTAAPPAQAISLPAQPSSDDPPTPTHSPHPPLDPMVPRTLDPDPANPIPNTSLTRRLLPAESVVS